MVTDYVFPFRVGRKQKRALLDANGLEVVIFPVGNEDMAEITCKMWNEFHQRLEDSWSSIEDIKNPPLTF